MDWRHEESKRHLPDPRNVLMPNLKFLLQNTEAFNYLKTPNTNNYISFSSWKTLTRFLCMLKLKIDTTFQTRSMWKPYYSSQVPHIPISSSMPSQEFDAFPEITNNSKARPHMEESIYSHNSLQWVFMNLLSQCKGSDCQWKKLMLKCKTKWPERTSIAAYAVEMSIHWFFKTVLCVNTNEASEKNFQIGIFFLFNIFF